MADGSILFDTKLDPEGIKKGLSGLGNTVTTALGNFAGTMMTRATDALVGFGQAAIDNGASFETSMAKASTLFTGTDTELADMQSKILDLSTAYGMSADSFAEAMYSAESASVKQQDLAAMLDASAKLSVAGFTDVDTALSATAKTMNAYGMEGEEAINKVQKVLIQTQNQGITTVGELGASLAQVTPTAAAFGVSFEQVGASLAVMTAQGTPTAQATTQLNSLIAELGKNGTQAAKNLEAAAEGTQWAGMSFNEMMENGANLNDVLGLMQEKADADGVAMVDMFSSIEAGKAAMSIFTQNGEVFMQDLEGMATDIDVVGEAYETMADTFETKSAKAQEGVKNLGIAIFDSLKGEASGMLDVANSYIDTLMKALQNGGPAAMVEAIGGILSDVVGKAATFAPKLVEMGIGLIKSLVTGLKANTGALIEGALEIVDVLVDGIIELLPMLLEVGLEIIIQLALGIAEALPEMIPEIVNLVLYLGEILLENLPLLIDAALQLFLGIIEGIWQAEPQIIEALPQLIEMIINVLIQSIPLILQASIDMLLALVQAIPQICGSLKTALPQIVNTITAGIRSFFGMVRTSGINLMRQFLNGIKSLAGSIASGARSVASGAVNAIKAAFSGIFSIGQDLIQGLWNGISAGWSWLTEKVGSLARSLLDTAKNALGIASPSKKFRWIGEMCVEGMSEGIAGMGDVLNGALDLSYGVSGAWNAGSSLGRGLAAEVADLIGDMKIVMDQREVGRMVRKVA